MTWIQNSPTSNFLRITRRKKTLTIRMKFILPKREPQNHTYGSPFHFQFLWISLSISLNLNNRTKIWIRMILYLAIWKPDSSIVWLCTQNTKVMRIATLSNSGKKIPPQLLCGAKISWVDELAGALLLFFLFWVKPKIETLRH